MMKKRKTGDKREKVLSRREGDDAVVVHRARIPGILAIVSSTSVDACKRLEHRDLNAAIRIRRYAELRRELFVKHHRRVEVCREKLKPIPDGW